MKLPFILNPVNWFLTGKDKKIALAKHNLSGYELDHKLLRIENEGPLSDEQLLELKKETW